MAKVKVKNDKKWICLTLYYNQNKKKIDICKSENITMKQLNMWLGHEFDNKQVRTKQEIPRIKFVDDIFKNWRIRK